MDRHKKCFRLARFSKKNLKINVYCAFRGEKLSRFIFQNSYKMEVVTLDPGKQKV